MGFRELPRRGRLWDESYAEHAHRLDDGIEARIPVFRKRFVEPRARHTSLLGKLCHSSVRARGDTDDVSHIRSVVTSFLEGCNEILGHLFRSLKVIGRIVASEPLGLSISSCHRSLPLPRSSPSSLRGFSGSCGIHFDRTFDIHVLGLHIAWIAHCESINPRGYARPGVRIVQTPQPRIKRCRAADLVHRGAVSYRKRRVNYGLRCGRQSLAGRATGNWSSELRSDRPEVAATHSGRQHPLTSITQPPERSNGTTLLSRWRDRLCNSFCKSSSFLSRQAAATASASCVAMLAFPP